ncbi:hypothetical protein [Campylobacter geochelonis]|uniref:hypothetical protein n=1 Tax=Campylobacter geochelonis TaxID=1780362 RepID=UPI00094D1C7C|nr:hypothetical protein [Campylobacter geochelonis]
MARKIKQYIENQTLLSKEESNFIRKKINEMKEEANKITKDLFDVRENAKTEKARLEQNIEKLKSNLTEKEKELEISKNNVKKLSKFEIENQKILEENRELQSKLNIYNKAEEKYDNNINFLKQEYQKYIEEKR